MNTWPDTDGRTIARYLGQLRLRCPTSPIYYRQALRTFQEVVIRDQRTPGQLGREVLETWLHEYAVHWPMATLLHRARIVNRFIDFLVEDTLEERKLAQLNLKRRVASAALDRRGASSRGEIEVDVESLTAHLARTAS